MQTYTVILVLALVAVVRAQPSSLSLTAANSINFLYLDGIQVPNTELPNYNNWQVPDTVDLETYARLIAIRVNNVLGGCSGLLVATINHTLGYQVVSDSQWKCSASPASGWEHLGYDDSSWTPAFEVGPNTGVIPGCSVIPIPGIPAEARWIWTPAHVDGDMVVSCRGHIPICDDSPCVNGGTCLVDNINLCRCPVRFGGRFCEENINECDSNPCQNGAHCDLTDEGYSCDCGVGYTGIHCETDITDCASSPCQNGGTCNFHADGGYQCDCVPGYSGDHCEFDIDECESEPCLNGATCIDRVNAVTCACAPGYTGLLCQNDINECLSSPCQNSGTCHDQVNGYICECHPGYQGTHCETSVGACASNPCLNGGTCTLGGPGGDVACLCPPGWFGPICASNEDECVSNPCLNGGTCIDGDERFDCVCEPFFTGTRCESVPPHCGTIMAQSEYAPSRNFWALCEINIIDHPSYVDTPCRNLIVGIPYYNNSETINAMGGTFGCYVTKYPDEMSNGACVPNYANDMKLSTCLSCTHMGVCINVPSPSN